MVMT